jgi:hypothetical protein
VDKILSAKPADLPMQQPTAFELAQRQAGQGTRHHCATNGHRVRGQAAMLDCKGWSCTADDGFGSFASIPG